MNPTTETQKKYEKLIEKWNNEDYSDRIVFTAHEILKDLKGQEEELKQKFKESLDNLKCYCEVCAFGDRHVMGDDTLYKRGDILQVLNNNQTFSPSFGEVINSNKETANLNVHVAEQEIGATESAPVGSSKRKDKISPNDTKVSLDDKTPSTLSSSKGTERDRGYQLYCNNCKNLREFHPLYRVDGSILCRKFQEVLK